MARRQSAEDRQAMRERLGRWLLALAVFGSGLALGSVHTPVLATVAVIAAAATALLWYDADPLEPRPAATMLVAVSVLLIGWTCLQLVPLPHSLLATIASENADVWARCLSPLRESGPSWAPISLDPIATRLQVLRGVTYLVVFIGAMRVAQRSEGLAFLERTLVVSTVAVGAAAFVHPVLGAHKVFGLYEPSEIHAYEAHHLGPLLNTNHLAAYLNIGVLIAFVSVIARRDAVPRPVALIVVLLLAASVVYSNSRGGTATMIVGAALAGLMAYVARRRRPIGLPSMVIVLVGVVGATVLLFGLFEGMAAKYAQNNLFKIDLIKNASQLLPDFGILGTGRGAFESTFPKVRTVGIGIGTGYWVYTHPENVLVQWTAEWGVPISIVAMIGIGWALRPQTALMRSRPPAGAWAAIVAVGAQNLVDYSSEVPGVMIAVCVCAAMVTSGTGGISGGSQPKRFAGWSRHPRMLAVGLAVATAIGVAVTLPFTGHELYNEQRSFRDLGLDRTLSREAFHDHAREAMRRHPAEPYFPFVGAVRATVAREESILPWAGRALERSPIYGRVHLLLARSLFVRNPSQARLEYRIACIQDTAMCAVDESRALVRSYDDALELVPDGPAGVGVLNVLTEKLGDRLPSSVVRLDRLLAERDPRDLGSVQRAAGAALKDLRAKEPWCEKNGTNGDKSTINPCLADGLAAAQRLRAAAPEKCEGHALVAELRVASGDVDAGFAELDAAVDKVVDRSTCARRLVTLASQTKNNARIDAALDRLINLGCASTECVDNLTIAAGIETARGSNRRALALTKKAWERAPERDDLLADVAQKAEQQGLHGEALEAYTKLSEHHPEEKQWGEAVTRERLAATRGVHERR